VILIRDLQAKVYLRTVATVAPNWEMAGRGWTTRNEFNFSFTDMIFLIRFYVSRCVSTWRTDIRQVGETKGSRTEFASYLLGVSGEFGLSSQGNTTAYPLVCAGWTSQCAVLNQSIYSSGLVGHEKVHHFKHPGRGWHTNRWKEQNIKESRD